MGNDGGTIAKRQDIISLHRELDAKNTGVNGLVDGEGPVCKISSLAFSGEKVVGDYKGFLYIKEKVLEKVLENLRNKEQVEGKKENDECELSHLRSLNDIVELQVTWQDNQMVCPVSVRKDVCYLRSCGCVVSFRMLNEVKKAGESDSVCPSCSKEFSYTHDIVRMDNSDERTEWNESKMKHLSEVLHVHHNKKPIKEKKKKTKKRSGDVDGESRAKKSKK
ncbi:hypothetical protein CAAN1_19S00430 [[Candida] anglica]|uniref:Replication termination factor 2 n=1 Tax=[Candida] anglica TaxID=148631 RepID=A0ABP0E5E8_9ASCO